MKLTISNCPLSAVSILQEINAFQRGSIRELFFSPFFRGLWIFGETGEWVETLKGTGIDFIPIISKLEDKIDWRELGIAKRIESRKLVLMGSEDIKLIEKMYGKDEFRFIIVANEETEINSDAIERVIADPTLNRDFPALQRIIDRGIPVEVILNKPYIWKCRFRDGVKCLRNSFKNCLIDDTSSCLQELCEQEFMQWLLRSRFVRPEDVTYYEQMGIEWFHLFLDAPLRTELISIYNSHKFNGNLFDLFHLNGGKQYSIGNQTLNKFLDYFLVNGNECNQKQCETCQYCQWNTSQILRNL